MINNNDSQEIRNRQVDLNVPTEQTLSGAAVAHSPLEVRNYSSEKTLVRTIEYRGAKGYALWGGTLMALIGIVSLIIPGSAENLPALMIQDAYGWFLGYFPMNIVNKSALVLFGILGVLSSLKSTASITWSKMVFLTMGLLAVLGLIPQTNTLFGYVPLFSGEIVSHAFFALLGLYFAYFSQPKNKTVPVVKTTVYPS